MFLVPEIETARSPIPVQRVGCNSICHAHFEKDKFVFIQQKLPAKSYNRVPNELHTTGMTHLKANYCKTIGKAVSHYTITILILPPLFL